MGFDVLQTYYWVVIYSGFRVATLYRTVTDFMGVWLEKCIRPKTRLQPSWQPKTACFTAVNTIVRLEFWTRMYRENLTERHDLTFDPSLKTQISKMKYSPRDATENTFCSRFRTDFKLIYVTVTPIAVATSICFVYEYAQSYTKRTSHSFTAYTFKQRCESFPMNFKQVRI